MPLWAACNPPRRPRLRPGVPHGGHHQPMTTLQRAPIERESTLEANKEIARQLIERIFIRQEDSAIDELVAEDFTPHTFGPMPKGREGLREGMKRAGAGVSDPTFE